MVHVYIVLPTQLFVYISAVEGADCRIPLTETCHQTSQRTPAAGSRTRGFNERRTALWQRSTLAPQNGRVRIGGQR